MTTSLPRAAPRGAPPEPGVGSRPVPAAVVAVRRIFGAETGNYFLLLGATLFLVVFGLIMVLSSGSIESLTGPSDNPFTGFLRQVMFAAIGLPLMLIAARAPARFWKKWAGLFMAVAIGLQFLVVATPLGYEQGGNTNWIKIGSFTGQPSEVVKVALVLFLGWALARKQATFDNWKDLVLSLVPVAGAAILFVLIGNDLGTVIILVSIVLGAMFFAGVKLRYLFMPILLAGVGGLIFVFASKSRSGRIDSFFNGCPTDTSGGTMGSCYQVVHGWWALASGGVFGVGLGNSKMKWSWVPEADNDFIFAIIGEELGLIGAILVLALFIVLAIAFVRIIRANPDPFARITTSAVMVWIIGQAFVNIAVVLGILPVLGVPLPLISSGGSALVTTMVGVGIVLSFARHAPQRDELEPAVAPR